MPQPPQPSFGAPHRLLALLVTMVLVVVGCGSDGDSSTGDSDTDDATTASADVATDDEGAADDGSGDASSAPIDPELVQALGLSLTGAELSASDVDCMVQAADGDSTLSVALGGPPSFTPELFTALAVATHGCIDNAALSASLLDLSGEDDPDARTAFSTCVLVQLDDETNGDLRYVGMSAMRVGFPVPEGATDSTVEALSTCLQPTGIGNQLASGAELASGFAIEVDRTCLLDGIDGSFLDELVPRIVSNDLSDNPAQALLEECSALYDSGLADALPTGWVPWTGDGALASVDTQLRNGLYGAPPPMSIDPTASYEAVLTTTDGEIRIELLAAQAPETVNNFVSLARDGYYDATTFHRVIDGFMAQGGDPSGTGSGGPGYSFADEEPGFTPVDRRGLLAMANSGVDTNGSQFFITFAPATHLDGLHVVFGEVIDGDDVLAAIDLRDPGAPTSRGEMLVSVEIIER